MRKQSRTQTAYPRRYSGTILNTTNGFGLVKRTSSFTTPGPLSLFLLGCGHALNLQALFEAVSSVAILVVLPLDYFKLPELWMTPVSCHGHYPLWRPIPGFVLLTT